MDKDGLLFGLARAIFEDPGLAGHEWDTVSVVFSAGDGSCSWYCYSYRGTAPTSVDLEADDLFELLLDFQAATANPDGTTWKACLFQLARDGELEVRFEQDPDRWRVTPATIDTIHRRIRMKRPAKAPAGKAGAATRRRGTAKGARR